MSAYSKKPVQKYIRCLERRREYLDQRITTSQSDLSYDKAERNALAWAIDQMKQLYPAKQREEEVSDETNGAEAEASG